MATIALADDHALLRLGLRRVLESRGHAVVAEVADGLNVLTIVRQFRPQLLLLDLGLPGMHGLDVLRDVTRRVPTTKVLVVSAYNREEYIVSALRTGAAGYLLKGADADELAAAVDEVAAGGYYVSPELEAVATRRSKDTTWEAYEELSLRERQVFKLLAEGQLNHQAAARLYISTRTVESHRSSLMNKLGLKTQTDIILFALRRGILVVDDAGGVPRQVRRPRRATRIPKPKSEAS